MSDPRDPTETDPTIHLEEFKRTARRLLRADHPLNRMLAKTPPTLRASQLSERLNDWLAVLTED